MEHVSRLGGGGAHPHLAYTGQVCVAERKVLSIKQGIQFYYCSSKILIIYFVISIVKYSREQCLFGLEALKRP